MVLPAHPFVPVVGIAKAVGVVLPPVPLPTTVSAAWLAKLVSGMALTLIAPAELIATGEVPLSPALPTLPIGIAVGIFATGNVPLTVEDPKAIGNVATVDSLLPPIPITN